MNRLYPVFIKLKNKRCVVVGGGTVACRKVKSLLETEATVKVISLKLCHEMIVLIKDHQTEYHQRAFQPADLEGAFMVIAATDDAAANQHIWDEANKKNILANVVDVSELCNFYVPSVIRDGDLAIAISTNGKAPYVAKKLRVQLQQFINKIGLNRIISLVDRKKQEVRKAFPQNVKQREKRIKQFTDNLFENLSWR